MNYPTGYIIYDYHTGAYDGVYLSKESAKAALNSLKKRVPQANWVLQEHTKSPELGDAKFWVNVYKEVLNKEVSSE